MKKREEKLFSNSELIPEVISLLEEGHTVTLPLRGYSMRPFLEDNRDKALLIRARGPKVGMPVLAEIGENYFVLHRIVSIKGENVVLRGDGNIGTERCKLSDVRAEAIGFYRKGREHIDRTNGLKWCLYSFLWTRLTPLIVRRYILAAYRRIVKTENIN